MDNYHAPDAPSSPTPSDNLLVIWSSGDREVALSMVFMYVMNAHAQNWWSKITLLVWGPSAELLAMDPELRAPIKRLIQAGVEVTACQACADRFDVSDRLAQLGLQVDYQGSEMTRKLQAGWKVLTF